jgi:hypothetical protein
MVKKIQLCNRQVLYDTVKKCELDLEYEMGISDVRLTDAIRLGERKCPNYWYFTFLYKLSFQWFRLG